MAAFSVYHLPGSFGILDRCMSLQTLIPSRIYHPLRWYKDTILLVRPVGLSVSPALNTYFKSAPRIAGTHMQYRACTLVTFATPSYRTCDHCTSLILCSTP